MCECDCLAQMRDRRVIPASEDLQHGERSFSSGALVRVTAAHALEGGACLVDMTGKKQGASIRLEHVRIAAKCRFQGKRAAKAPGGAFVISQLCGRLGEIDDRDCIHRVDGEVSGEGLDGFVRAAEPHVVVPDEGH